MFSIVLFLIFALGLIKDYGKWVCLSMIVMVLFMPMNLWGQTVSVFLSALICILFPFKYKNVSSIEKFPLTLPIVILSFSYFISNYFSFEKHNGAMISSILSYCLIVVVFFYVFMKDKARLLPFFIKACLIFGTIVSFYSIFETIIGDNPMMRYLIDNKIVMQEDIISDVRFGMKRSQGIFTMHGTNGAVAVELFAILLSAQVTGYLKKSRFIYWVISLLALTVFMTGTRSAIISLLICFFAFFNPQNFKLKYLTIGIVFLFFVYLCFQSYVDEIIVSFVDTESVEGSNADMREEQLNVALMFFSKSPIYGNGIAYCVNNVMGVYRDMYGAESLWFPAMIDTGILGVLGYIMFFIYCMSYCRKRKMNNLSFFVLSFFVLNTMSSIPGLSITWIFPFLLVLIEMKQATIDKKYFTVKE